MARIREIMEKDVTLGAEILATSEPWVSRGETRENVSRILGCAVGRGNTFVAEEDSLPAGLACFVPDPIIAGGGCLRFIAVRSEKRRQGIGRQLMGFVERKVFSKSPNIYVSVSPANVPALRFFEKLGYQKVGEVADLYVAGEPEWILRKPWKGRSHEPIR
jgi:ribosomal protein S18 acetylase RimI-like enzyme